MSELMAPSTPPTPRTSRKKMPPGASFALLAALVCAASPWLTAFQITLVNTIGLAAIGVLGLVLFTGVGGMTSFGQAAFVGIGAYTAAWLTTTTELTGHWSLLASSPWLTLVVAMALTALAAWVIGSVTLRLSGHFLPLGTICWALALYFLFGTSDQLGSHTGISGLPALQLGAWTLDQPQHMTILIWVILGISLIACRFLLDSRTGRAISALNGGQGMAASMGVNVVRAKLTVFILSALLACVSGWIYAFDQRFVSPAPFGLGAGIDLLFMGLIGGIGQLWGAVIGASVVTLTRNELQDWLPRLLGQSGDYDAIVFGLFVIVLMQRMPSGLYGQFVRRFPQFRWDAREGTVDTSIAALPRRTMPKHGTPVLEVRKLSRRFGGLVANRDIDLTLHGGELLAVIGPNGAGKSTLFNQLSCVDRPSAGEVRLLGRRVNGWAPQRIAAAGLSRTFQHVRLLPAMSVLDNVAIGAHLRGRGGVLRSMLRLEREEERRLLAEAQRQLERVGLADLARQQAGTLALGQQRLLEIARALCADPAVLLLDEPAAGLRLQEKEALAALLNRLRDEGVAVLLVEHDMDFVMSLADRVMVMVFGEKIAEGLPAEVQAHPKVLEAYLGADL